MSGSILVFKATINFPEEEKEEEEEEEGGGKKEERRRKKEEEGGRRRKKEDEQSASVPRTLMGPLVGPELTHQQARFATGFSLLQSLLVLMAPCVLSCRFSVTSNRVHRLGRWDLGTGWCDKCASFGSLFAASGAPPPVGPA
jgi:hypothetical protein